MSLQCRNFQYYTETHFKLTYLITSLDLHTQQNIIQDKRFSVAHVLKGTLALGYIDWSVEKTCLLNNKNALYLVVGGIASFKQAFCLKVYFPAGENQELSSSSHLAKSVVLWKFGEAKMCLGSLCMLISSFLHISFFFFKRVTFIEFLLCSRHILSPWLCYY